MTIALRHLLNQINMFDFYSERIRMRYVEVKTKTKVIRK